MSYPNQPPPNSGDGLQEVERMIQSFRLNELRQLLVFAEYPHGGRKDQLIERALSLVRTKQTPLIFAKVKQLHWQLWDQNKALVDANYSAPTTNLVGNNSTSVYRAPMSFAGVSTVRRLGTSPPRNVAPIPPVQVRAPTVSLIQQNATKLNIAMHPAVKLTDLPFYDVSSEIMKPTTLVPLSATKFQDNHLIFTLTQDQLLQLRTGGSSPLPRVEFQLRFCLLDLTKAQPDDFPSGCVLRLNDKIVPIPNPIPTNKVGAEPKRPSRPVDITPHVNQKPNCDQRIQVSWHNDNVRFWTVSVYVVKHLTTQILLDRVHAKGPRREEESVDMIKVKLGADGYDGDIAATSLRVSLLCPLGKIRLRQPCRMGSCKHLQCFDLELFLQMNEKRPTWTCPVCDAPIVPFSDLQIDGYFSRVLYETKDDVQEVELYEGGKFSAIMESVKQVMDDGIKPVEASVSNKEQNKTLPASSQSKIKEPLLPTPVPKPSSSNEFVVIDLSSDDDDDDDDNYTFSVSSRPSTSQKSRTTDTNSTSSNSSPSVIVLDSPSPPRSTPEDPKTADDIRRDGNCKRPLSTTICVQNLPPKKQFRAAFETSTAISSPSLVAAVDTRQSTNAPKSPPKQADNGSEFASTYATMMKQLITFGTLPVPAPQQGHTYAYSSMPHAGGYIGSYLPAFQPVPTTHRSDPPSVASPSNSNGVGYSNQLAREYQDFDSFLRSCFPPQ